MYNVHCTMYIVQCTLYNVHCTMYIVQCTLYNVHCTMYIVQCTMYSVYTIHQLTICTIHYTVDTTHTTGCTLYSEIMQFSTFVNYRVEFSYIHDQIKSNQILLSLVSHLISPSRFTVTIVDYFIIILYWGLLPICLFSIN